LLKKLKDEIFVFFLSFFLFAGVVALEKAWTTRDGGRDYRVENSMAEVTDFLAKDLEIRLNWEVKQIQYPAPRKVILKSSKGQELHANRVVVSVPLSILKEGNSS
jgi:predicted NAD/FAD-dependent oxidoreductase